MLLDGMNKDAARFRFSLIWMALVFGIIGYCVFRFATAG
jgi:hypothetical protein